MEEEEDDERCENAVVRGCFVVEMGSGSEGSVFVSVGWVLLRGFGIGELGESVAVICVSLVVESPLQGG
jgi:hypothetical protein